MGKLWKLPLFLFFKNYFMLRLFTFFLFFLISVNAFTQNFWKQVNDKQITSLRNSDRGVIPEKYATFAVDFEKMQVYLKNAPENFNHNEAFLFEIPMPDGTTMSFDVINSPVMEKGLAVKYPEISTYKGRSIEDESINIRFSISPRGFFASVYWPGNNIYIDAYDENNTDYCISYFTKDYLPDLSGVNLTCGVDNKFIQSTNHLNNRSENDKINTQSRSLSECEPVYQYNYTIAIACTGEWGKKHGNTIASALADIVTSVTRLNQIYENEFAIHLNLTEKNDKLIWLDPETDPFEVANVGGALLSVIGNVISSTIGTNSYDVGHVFTNSCTDVGGIAMLSGVCSNFLKGNGVTCHYYSDLNYIVTNVTAHELGHQFSAVHTFNNCGGNESDAGFEPGGGNSIMAYCGLCGSNNVSYPCTENFHAYSVEQVMKYTRIGGGNGCAEKISTGNTSPEVTLNYKNGFYIPAKTYFYLDAQAKDCEGDDMLFSWEQMNTGPQTPIGQPVDNSPIFAAIEPSNSTRRYFPALKSIINNNFNNSEILPTYSRNLDFRFIARDNHQNAGGTDWADVSFKVDGDAGPFKITYPQSAISFKTGQGVEVKWNVANTDNAKVNCKYVDIFLSTDFGYNFPYLLKFRTPNDGSEVVYLPDHVTPIGKFMIKANNNIFFDMDKYGFSIVNPAEKTFVFDIESQNGILCLPNDGIYNITTRTTNNYSDSLHFEIDGLPEFTKYKVIPSKIKAGDNAKIHFDFSDVREESYFQPVIYAISDSGDTIKRDLTWQFYTNNYKNIEISNPLPGKRDVNLNPTFNWQKVKSSEYVNFYLSKNPSFSADNSYIRTEIKDTFHVIQTILDYSTVYYWKLEFVNECGLIVSDTTYTFSTLAYKCSEYESADVPVSINDNKPCISGLTIEDQMEIADIKVHMKGSHTEFKEINASLIAPDSSKLQLFTNKSFNYQGEFNLTFDDNASSKMKTPPKGTYRPDNPLSFFLGKKAKGRWNLEIIDTKDQQAGRLDIFKLNICAVSIPKNPYIVNNHLLKIPYKTNYPISTEFLKVADENNTDDQLIFTLVKIPKSGSVFLNNTKLNIGDIFTQNDLNNGYVTVRQEENEKNDFFYFTVTDGDGGWIGNTRFDFVVDKALNNKEEIFNYQVLLYPNPASSFLNIFIDNIGTYRYKVIDLKGQKLMTGQIEGYSNSMINLGELRNGLYIIKIENEKYNYVSKLVIQK